MDKPVPHRRHGKVLPGIDVIVVQPEGSVKFYPSPKGSSSRQEIINLLLMAARTLEFILLNVFVRTDVADNAAVGIVMRHLLDVTIAIYYHPIVAPFGRVREKAHIIMYLSSNMTCNYNKNLPHIQILSYPNTK